MKGRKQVKEAFDLFAAMLETDDFSDISTVFNEESSVITTHLGKAIGLKEIKELWTWKGKPVNHHRFLKFNHVIHIDNDKAVESVYLLVQSGNDSQGVYHHFNYGGYFSNIYNWIDDAWKINTMRFQLDIFEGNTLLVDGWWKPLSTKLYSGYQIPSILSYFDAPWRIIPNMDEMSAEEKICDTIFKYAWANDHMDSELLASTLSKDYSVDYGQKGVVKGIRSMVELGFQVRFKEYTLQHLYHIRSIDIVDDRAHVVFYRHEPHRLGSHVLSIDNREGIFYSAIYDLTLRVEDGQWKLYQGSYTTGVFYCEDVQQDETEAFYFK